MQKIRSIQVVNVRWFNATAWYGMYLSRLLREAGHETIVLGLGGTASFRRAEEWGLEPLALPLNSSNPLKLASLYQQLGKIVADFKPDIVNCHRGEAFILWGMLRQKGGYALVRTRGDQRLPKKGLPNRLLHQRSADALIATNSRTAEALSQRLGITPEALFTILGGVDTASFYPDGEAGAAVRRQLGFAADEFVVGLLGRLDSVKGHKVVMRALGEIRKTRPQSKFRFLCIGAPSQFSVADIIDMATAAGIGDRIAVTGLVDNVRGYINALNLGVLASVGSEAIARAALEIMACRVPLLSTDVGVMPDLLPSDLTVRIGDAGGMAEAIVRCMDEAGHLEKLALAGDVTMRSLRPEDFLNKTLAAYKTAIDRRGISP